jgi:hypothetical protein
MSSSSIVSVATNSTNTTALAPTFVKPSDAITKAVKINNESKSSSSFSHIGTQTEPTAATGSSITGRRIVVSGIAGMVVVGIAARTFFAQFAFPHLVGGVVGGAGAMLGIAAANWAMNAYNICYKSKALPSEALNEADQLAIHFDGNKDRQILALLKKLSKELNDIDQNRLFETDRRSKIISDIATLKTAIGQRAEVKENILNLLLPNNEDEEFYFAPAELTPEDVTLLAKREIAKTKVYSLINRLNIDQQVIDDLQNAIKMANNSIGRGKKNVDNALQLLQKVLADLEKSSSSSATNASSSIKKGEEESKGSSAAGVAQRSSSSISGASSSSSISTSSKFTDLNPTKLNPKRSSEATMEEVSSDDESDSGSISLNSDKARYLQSLFHEICAAQTKTQATQDQDHKQGGR